MRIEWLGQSSFLIGSEQGIRIITDPFGRGFLNLPALFWRMDYKEADEEAEIVTVSHPHWDHSNIRGVRGRPTIVKNAGTTIISGIHFKGIPSRHGMPWVMRKQNMIFCFQVDGVRLCHLGDIGEVLNKNQLRDIGEVDILFVPTGGFMTVGPAGALKICRQLNPHLIVPMHYKNPQCRFPLFLSLDKFCQNFSQELFCFEGTKKELVREKLLAKELEISIFLPAL